MNHYKKIVIIIIFILFIGSVYMIYNINSIYPNTKDNVFVYGDETRYKGLKITVGDMEMYTKGEFIEQYPEIKTYFDIYESQNSMKYNYIIVNVTIENDTNNMIAFGKIDTLSSWVIESGMDYNGVEIGMFVELNPLYDGSFSNNEEQNIKIPFSFPEGWMTYEELVKEDKKVVFSYYPSKSFLFYKGKK